MKTAAPGRASAANSQLMARREAAVARGVAHALPVFAGSACGAEIVDAEGRRLIDFASGIAVMNVGHGNPAVQAAIAAQLQRFTHVSFQVMPYEVYVALAERLNALFPGEGPAKSVFFSTGAEAVENAVKIARAHTGRSGVICFTGGFHGRTLLTLGMTGKVNPYKTGFGPFPGEVFHAPYPAEYRGVDGAASLAAIERLFKGDIEPERVAAIVIEPVLGEGGFYAAPAEFLRSLRALCDEHGIVLVADEIQAGFARTGRMFGIEHSGVKPDLITVAKSLAGGLPLSGVVGTARIMDAPGPGGLGGTYGGNPVACAAGLAVLDEIERLGLCARATAIGRRMTTRLGALAAQPGFACLGDVRTLGAMTAIELVRDRTTREPDAALTKAVCQRAAQLGLIVLSCGLYSNVIRMLVPLSADDALVDEGLGLLERALREAQAAA